MNPLKGLIGTKSEASVPTTTNITQRIGNTNKFSNTQGDWAKLEKVGKEILTYGEVIDGLAKDLMTASDRLEKLMLEAYLLAPQVDALFYDSPVSPARQSYFLRAFLRKLGFKGIRDVIVDDSKIKTFAEEIRDSVKWLQKFNKGRDEQ